MEDLLAFRQAAFDRGETVVLATVIETEGSTYRKAGARMLIDEHGQFAGLVSGGCLEGNLLLEAKKVFALGFSRVVEYDMRAEEEGLWGLSLGCNGLVRIHLQKLQQGEPSWFDLQDRVRASRQSAVLATEIEPAAEGVSAFSYRHGEKVVSHGLDSAVFLAGESQASARGVLVNDEGQQILFELLKPPRHLLLLGAGPDAGPLCQLAKQLSWEVSLLDHRVAYINKARRLGADRCDKIDVDGLLSAINLSEVDAVVVMSHSVETDKAYLKALCQQPPAYVGLLGPKQRAELLQEDLSVEERSQLAPVLHGPIGLDLGGEGPVAIALSVVAEIQAVWHKRDAKPLKFREGPISA